MKDSKENKAEGKFDKVKGEMKDKYGKLTDDKSKQASGKMDKVKGEMKEKVGEMKDKSKNNHDDRH